MVKIGVRLVSQTTLMTESVTIFTVVGCVASMTTAPKSKCGTDKCFIKI